MPRSMRLRHRDLDVPPVANSAGDPGYRNPIFRIQGKDRPPGIAPARLSRDAARGACSLGRQRLERPFNIAAMIAGGTLGQRTADFSTLGSFGIFPRACETLEPD